MNSPAEPVSLSPAERKALKARAHHLKPVVMIGEAGLTDPVLAEADRALASHALIKIRVLGDDRERRQALLDDLCGALACAPVQMIGKLLVVYRPRPDEDAAGLGSSSKRRPRGPHRPKKTLGAAAESGGGRSPASAPRRTAKAHAAAAAEGRTRVSTGSTGSRSSRGRAERPALPAKKSGRGGTASASSPTAGKSRSSRTAGKRTDPGAAARPPAKKRRATKATQGPARLQGKPGPRTGGRRDRAKGGKG